MLRRCHSDGVLHSATHSNNTHSNNNTTNNSSNNSNSNQLSSNAQLLLSLNNPHTNNNQSSYSHGFPSYAGAGGVGLPSSSATAANAARGVSGGAGLLEGVGGSLEGSGHDEIMFLPSDDDPFMVLGLGE